VAAPARITTPLLGTRNRARQLIATHALQIAAALVAAAALGGALYRVPALVRIAHHSLNLPGSSVEDADLDPLHYYVSIGALVAARNTMPKGATYTVVVGHDPPLDNNPSTAAGDAHAIRVMFLLYMMPDRYTPDIHEARWVIAYHQRSSTLGIKYSKQSYLSYDANLLEVAR